jgi:DNA helicase-2/ATP-dependent DNA helicase PcrA
MAVLVRVAHHGTWIEQALSRRGIPFELLGVTNFWTLTEVKRALRAIQEVTGAQVAPDSEPTPRWLMEKIGEPSGNFVKDARSVCHAVARSPSKVITGQRREAWQAAMNVLAEEIKVLGSPKAFGDFVKARGAVGQRGDQKGVSLGTIHAAKGLEWSAVFLAACEEGVLPHAKNDDIEEERRLAFVAITRARNFVGVSYALSRGRQEAAPSPFVGEMLRAAGPGVFKRSSD